MKAAVFVAGAVLLSVQAAAIAAADVSGFVQLRAAHRVKPLPDCRLNGCDSMVEEGLAELLLERSWGPGWSLSLRPQAHREVISDDAALALREGTIAWQPGASVDVKIGRQIITWGVSDYLFANDLFPRNYDAFFTGGSFDRMKEPVDAMHLSWRGHADLELVLSRSKLDRMPSPSRFAATGGASSAVASGAAPGSGLDAAVKAATKWGNWDLALYAARLRSRELRYYLDTVTLRSDIPRVAHLGVSATGNAASGVAWLEAALRQVKDGPEAVADRQFLGSSGKLILGYSRDIADGVTASAQVQLESPLSRGRYLRSLASGVRPVATFNSILHLRITARGMNQTLGSGAQLFMGAEGDSHFNPFMNWSPVDGWTLETGANLFSGRSDTRFGTLKRDSNVYLAMRRSY